MKIAMIGLKGVSSRAGGVEIHVEEIGKRLVKMGHEVYVYTRPYYTDKTLKEYEGLKIKSIPTLNTKHLDAIIHTFLSTIDSLRKDFDIIHFHAIGPASMCFIPKLAGKKVVCTIHSLDWKREKWGYLAKTCLRLAEKIAVTVPDGIIAVSKTLKQYIEEKYKKDCWYIPNGVNPAQKVEPQVIKEKYCLEKDGYFLYLSRLVPEKGVHYLIDAYNRLETTRKLVIAGGSSHSEEYERYLKALAGDDKNIIFTGQVEGQELKELFSNAYAYILPSEVEGLPIALLEAMSFGQCVVTSDISENMEIIEDKGISFMNRIVESLYDVLYYINAYPEAVTTRKRMAEEYVLSKYNWDQISVDTEKVYKSILQEKA